MRISAKGRYGIAAMTYLGQHGAKGCVPVIHISEQLDISKIYLEQVFSLLKKEGLVTSVKGPHGGYQLTKEPSEITSYEILKATDGAIFEQVKSTVSDKAPGIEKAIDGKVFSALDTQIESMLTSVTLDSLVEEANKYQRNDGYMFFI